MTRVIVLIFGVALGLVFIAAGVSDIVQRNQLERQGVEQSGTIVRRDITQRSKGKGNSYYLDVRWTDGGKEVERKFLVDREFFSNHTARDGVTVKAVPGQPKTAILQGTTDVGWPFVVGGFAWIGTLITVLRVFKGEGRAATGMGAHGRITCGWCGAHFDKWKDHCDSCGGPMPPRPGFELGEAPPAAPRALPKRFAFRQKWSGNFHIKFGAVFTGIGLVMCAIFLTPGRATLLGVGIVLLFPAFGLLTFWIGRRRIVRMLNALAYGTAVQGEVAGVTLDSSVSVAGQHPWKLAYQFPVNGRRYQGAVCSWDDSITAFAAGQPLWILYVADDPEQNAIYPPLK